MYMYLILHYMSFISGTYHKPHIYIYTIYNIYIYIYIHNIIYIYIYIYPYLKIPISHYPTKSIVFFRKKYTIFLHDVGGA